MVIRPGVVAAGVEAPGIEGAGVPEGGANKSEVCFRVVRGMCGLNLTGGSEGMIHHGAES
jgi:hypothetical protein